MGLSQPGPTPKGDQPIRRFIDGLVKHTMASGRLNSWCSWLPILFYTHDWKKNMSHQYPEPTCGYIDRIICYRQQTQNGFTGILATTSRSNLH